MTERKLHVNYDEKNDILNVHVGEENEAVVVRVDDNLYVRLSVDSGEVVGYTISHYSENVHKNRHWSDKLLTVPQPVGQGAFVCRRERRAA